MDAANSAVSSITNAVKQGFQSPHDVARTGFGSGTNAHYDRARPSYPAESLQQIHSALSETAKSRSAGLNILELGSGTGLFSRLLLAPPSSDYPTFKVHSLYAVEPSEGMRNQWNKSLDTFIQQGSYSRSSASGEVDTLSGGFQELSAVKERVKEKGEKEQWADLVIAAQAWHWCHPEYEAALREITTVLAPDGVLVFIWNYEDRDTRYPQALKDFEYSLENDTPQQRRGLWEATFDSQFYKDNFVEERGERKRVHWTSVVSDQKRIDRILSKSYVAMRPDAEKEQIVAKIKEFLAADHNQEWVDKEAGTYIQRWWTDVIIMRRK